MHSDLYKEEFRFLNELFAIGSKERSEEVLELHDFICGIQFVVCISMGKDTACKTVRIFVIVLIIGTWKISCIWREGQT